MRTYRRTDLPAALAVTLLLCGADASHAQALPPALTSYAVLGLKGTILRRGTRVPGGAVGAVLGLVRLGPDARVSGVVAGPTLRLESGARTGNVFCHLVSGPPTLPLCRAFVDPLVAPTLLAPVPVVPGGQDLRVPPHTGSAPLPPASYRRIRVGAGSLLQLAGGSYAASSIRLGRSAQLLCVADCRIGVVGAVRAGPGAALGAADATRASGVRVDVGAAGPGSAFAAGPRANVSATVFAPGGNVRLGSLGAYRGAFVGRVVTVGAQATVREDSAL